MTRLIVWRHGNTDWNADGRVQGQRDIPLNELGRQQAAAAAELLVKLDPSVIVSSDLRRAADTAAALAALTGLGVRTDPRLRERHLGAWQGLLMAQIRAQRPEQYARWAAGADAIGDGIETLTAVGKRMVDAFVDVGALDSARTVVVATHGASARQGVAQLLGWPAEQSRTLRALRNCHWVELVHHQARGWQMCAYNVGPFTDWALPAPG